MAVKSACQFYNLILISCFISFLYFFIRYEELRYFDLPRRPFLAFGLRFYAQFFQFFYASWLVNLRCRCFHVLQLVLFPRLYSLRVLKSICSRQLRLSLHGEEELCNHCSKDSGASLAAVMNRDFLEKKQGGVEVEQDKT